jgi:hypothetical protein
LHGLLMDIFNLLEVGLLVQLEHQLLEVRHASHSKPPAPNSNRS